MNLSHMQASCTSKQTDFPSAVLCCMLRGCGCSGRPPRLNWPMAASSSRSIRAVEKMPSLQNLLRSSCDASVSGQADALYYDLLPVLHACCQSVHVMLSAGSVMRKAGCTFAAIAAASLGLCMSVHATLMNAAEAVRGAGTHDMYDGQCLAACRCGRMCVA